MGIKTAAMQSCVFFALALAAVAFGSSHTEDFSEGYELLQDVPAEENLLSAVHEMRQFAPKHLQEHVKVVAHHAELIQDSKAKAYAHDFTKSQAANKKMDAIADNNICGGLSTTWGDMDIDKSTAKYGTALRNGWDKVRTDFVKAT